HNLIRYGINPGILLPPFEIAQKRLNKWKEFWTDNKIKNTQQQIYSAAKTIGFSDQLAMNFDPLQKELNLYTDSNVYNFVAQMHPFIYSKDDSLNAYVGVSQLKIHPNSRKVVFEAFNNIPGVIITDNQHLNEQLLNFINIDFNNLIFYSGLLVFLALLIAYGRLELALISFLPMALSWIWILGIMSVFDLQ